MIDSSSAIDFYPRLSLRWPILACTTPPTQSTSSSNSNLHLYKLTSLLRDTSDRSAIKQAELLPNPDVTALDKSNYSNVWCCLALGRTNSSSHSTSLQLTTGSTNGLVCQWDLTAGTYEKLHGFRIYFAKRYMVEGLSQHEVSSLKCHFSLGSIEHKTYSYSRLSTQIQIGRAALMLLLGTEIQIKRGTFFCHIKLINHLRYVPYKITVFPIFRPVKTDHWRLDDCKFRFSTTKQFDLLHRYYYQRTQEMEKNIPSWLDTCNCVRCFFDH